MTGGGTDPGSFLTYRVKPTTPPKRQGAKEINMGVSVWVIHEYGYEVFLWETDFSPAQLEAWWKDEGPGFPLEDMREVEEDPRPSELKKEELLKEFPSKSDEERFAMWAEWYKRAPFLYRFCDTGEPVRRAAEFWTAHQHLEEDSYLKDPQGNFI